MKSFRPKICLRKSNIIQKSLKCKGKKSSIAKLVKKPVGHISDQTNRPIGVIILTELYLICFEDEQSSIPLFLFPVSDLSWSKCSDDTWLSFSCSADKGTFQFSDSVRFSFPFPFPSLPLSLSLSPSLSCALSLSSLLCLSFPFPSSLLLPSPPPIPSTPPRSNSSLFLTVYI